jgi:hypothetical protein
MHAIFGAEWTGVFQMSEYDFTLWIDGGLTPERMTALYDSGCSDMTFQGDETGPASADVHREAPSLVAAILSAIRDIERVPGLHVREVENPDLVGVADLAWRLNRTPESVRLLATGKRRKGGFPAPAARRRRGQLWRWIEVAAWANNHLGTNFDLEEPARIAAVNTALAMRRDVKALPEPERRTLRDLALADSC